MNDKQDQTLKVRRYETYDLKDMGDLIACLAANIENAYRTAGVDDYTAKECVNLAASTVLPKVFEDCLKDVTCFLDTTPNG